MIVARISILDQQLVWLLPYCAYHSWTSKKARVHFYALRRYGDHNFDCFANDVEETEGCANKRSHAVSMYLHGGSWLLATLYSRSDVL